MGQESSAPRPRVLSIDALRGFDMFWITGGREVILGLAALVSGTVPPLLDYHLSHPEWTGFSGWDLIMPLFLFLVGAVLPYSLAAEKASGRPMAAIYLRMARRVVLLWILGMIAQGNLLESIYHLDFSELRLFSNTLQAIAAGYLIAGFAVLHLPLAGQIGACAALLILYWLLLALVPAPGLEAGLLEPRANLALYIDEIVLRGFRDGTTYTWILSSLGFGATTLLGVFAGHILKLPASHARRLTLLIMLGLGCLLLGALWNLYLPIIKHIWTSSMVLWAAGWSYLLLALFYLVVDAFEWRRWTFPFTVIGSNAILAYMLGEKWVEFWNHLFIDDGSPVAHGLVSLAALAGFWGLLYVLYRRRIFLRV